MKPSASATRARRPKATPLLYLVDDEPLLLDLAEMALSKDGYRLKKFLDPEKAHDAFVRARVKPDMIVSDYAMGRTNGIDLLARCKALAPALKTVLVSGTVGPEIVFNASVSIDRFLAKPYQPEVLAELVRNVLAGTGDA